MEEGGLTQPSKNLKEGKSFHIKMGSDIPKMLKKGPSSIRDGLVTKKK